MINVPKGIYFTALASVFLMALCTRTLPAADNAPTSTVLAKGQALREGLTSLYTVPKGINGSYEINGEVVYFETRRGARTPKFLRKTDPTTPEFEIDVRFMDEDGQPFLIQIGGHAPIDETWTEATAEFKNDEQTQAGFKLAAKAIETLRKVKFTPELEYEHRALLALTPLVTSAQVIEKTEEAGDQALRSQAIVPASIYQHKVEIHHKSCCLGLGRHSATIGKYISRTGVTTTAVITCNHGTCAQQMALKCSWTSASPGNRSNHVLNDIACSTPYNPSSVFGHNSNDDTDLQYRAVRYNVYPSKTGGICNNSSSNTKPTDCY